MEALKKLITKYESITLEQLEKLFDKCDYGYEVMEILTGFGNITTCIVCEEAQRRNPDPKQIGCEYCIYKKIFPYSDDKYYCMDDTYRNMSDAESAEELYEAIQERVKLLKQNITWQQQIKHMLLETN